VSVERIYVAPGAGAAQDERARVRVEAGRGILGDRYFGSTAEPGQNLTLIEIEELEALAGLQQRALDPACSRRNILTRGVRLNALVGREFLLGSARLRGVELCEPCAGFGRNLSAPGWSAARVVKHFVHRAGLRADVLESGEIGLGDALQLPP